MVVFLPKVVVRPYAPKPVLCCVPLKTTTIFFTSPLKLASVCHVFGILRIAFEGNHNDICMETVA